MRDNIKGKDRIMVGLRKEFAGEFLQKGFGFVEGSKWISHIECKAFVSVGTYMTEMQFNKEEAGCPVATQS